MVHPVVVLSSVNTTAADDDARQFHGVVAHPKHLLHRITGFPT